MKVEFSLPVKPVPLKRHRTSFVKGKMINYDPSIKDKNKIKLLSTKYIPKKILIKPVLMEIKFYITRPKSHYRTGKYKHLLKNSAPKYHTSTPDLSNLVKLIEDAYNGFLYKDDSQIIETRAIKLYTEGEPSIKIIVEELL